MAGLRAFGLRVPVVLATLALVLALLFGLQLLLQRQAVALPLATRLREVPGVVGQPSITSGSGGLQIDVHLGPVSDLHATYQQLVKAAAQGGGRHPVVHVEDTRDATLTADYYKLNVILAQGRATGQFVPMEQQFNAEAAKLGLDRAQVVLGDAQMYVTLALGGHYLYQILPLTLPGGSGGAAA